MIGKWITRLTQAWCGALTGHAYVLERRGPHRIGLKCLYCERQTPGWDLCGRTGSNHAG